MGKIKLHHWFIGGGTLTWIALPYMRIMFDDSSVQMEIKFSTIMIIAILLICTGFIVRGKNEF